jgi:hypothetical protein
MTMRILGATIPGQGDASTNNRVLIPAAALHCPAVANYGLYGTINVRLDEPLSKSHADCWTPRFPWRPLVWQDKPYEGPDRHEEFGFTKIKFEFPLNGELYDAWIIMPARHPATYLSGNRVEIIAAVLISGQRIGPGHRCAIHLDHTPLIPRPATFGDNWIAKDHPGRLW